MALGEVGLGVAWWHRMSLSVRRWYSCVYRPIILEANASDGGTRPSTVMPMRTAGCVAEDADVVEGVLGREDEITGAGDDRLVVAFHFPGDFALHHDPPFVVEVVVTVIGGCRAPGR